MPALSTIASAPAQTPRRAATGGTRPQPASCQLVLDIAASIRAKTAAGITAEISTYTPNPVTLALVEAELGIPQTLRHEQPAEAQALRRQQPRQRRGKRPHSQPMTPHGAQFTSAR